MIAQFRAMLERRAVTDTIALFIFAIDRSKSRTSEALPIVFRDVDENAIREVPRPAIELSREAAQELLEELWRLGFRPSKEGSEGQLAAVTRHLEDQRALSWRLLDLVAQRWRSDETLVFTTEEKSS